MTKIPVEIGKKKLARRQYSMMGSEIGNNNRTNGLHTKCRRQHIVKIYRGKTCFLYFNTDTDTDILFTNHSAHC